MPPPRRGKGKGKFGKDKKDRGQRALFRRRRAVLPPPSEALQETHA